VTYERYAELRDQRGLTDYAVSKAIDITQSTLSDWKNARYTPKLDKLLKIAKLFGMSLDELIGDDTE
jgi:transcriptional regulator with XRE-family HTH domain